MTAVTTSYRLLAEDCAKKVLSQERELAAKEQHLQILQRRVRELREQLESREKEIDLLAAALDRLDPEGVRR